MNYPNSLDELASLLSEANAKSQTITLGGNSSKALMGGPLAPADVSISTVKLNRVLQYEPRDLTISVEAGITFRELRDLLAANRQMIPLDPPFSDQATVGGVVASNSSGPRRRLYGTARDVVIGMTFATLEGKLVQTGGMVVKNVAGLDMGKLMIGSFGTLAAIGVVNFRLHPMAEGTRTFVLDSSDLKAVMAARDSVLARQLLPAVVDILKSASGYRLMVQAGGSEAVLDRYTRDLEGFRTVTDEQKLWDDIREFTPRYLAEHPNGMVVRASTKLSEVGPVLESFPGPALSRAGSGVTYGYFADAAKSPHVIEYAPQDFRASNELWPSPGSDFAMMKKIKGMFDPGALLNRGRLYGRI